MAKMQSARKVNKKAGQKPKKKSAPKPLTPLVTPDTVRVHCMEGMPLEDLNVSPIWNALKQIHVAATHDFFAEKRPKKLKKLGKQLLAGVLPGYEDAVEYPLTAQQLLDFLNDEKSVAFVQTHRPRVLGPGNLSTLRLIAQTLIASTKVETL